MPPPATKLRTKGHSKRPNGKSPRNIPKSNTTPIPKNKLVVYFIPALGIRDMLKSAAEQIKSNQTIYDLFSQVKNAPGKVIDLSLGNPIEKPPKAYLDALLTTTKAMIETDHNSFLYQAGFGNSEASSRISNDLQERLSLPFSKEQVIMTVGATGALDSIISTIVGNRRALKKDSIPEVIVLTPHFVEYDTIIEHAGARVVTVLTNDDYSMHLQNIRDAVSPDTVAILLNSPNNPTGTIYGERELIQLATALKAIAMSRRNTITVIEDSVYDRVIPPECTVPSMMPLWHATIRVDSFSKSLRIPGERIGYCAVHPDYKTELDRETLLEAVRLRVRSRVVHPSVIQQKVVAHLGLLQNSECYFYDAATDVLIDTLETLGFTVTPPNGTFYIWAKLPEAIESEQHFRDAAFSGDPALIYMPGSVFGGSVFDRYIRLSTCVADETIDAATEQLPILVEQCTKGTVTP